MDSKLASDDLLAVHMDGYYKGYDHGKSDAKARIAELTAALKPFADAADHWIGPDEASIVGGPCTLGDLRAARAAYLGEKE